MTGPTTLPAPRTPDPMSAPALRWGILAPGGIAAKMAIAMARHTRQQIVAVGSRSLDRAQAFAAEFGVARAYGSYEDLVADPQVQAVYVASPHSEHAAHALLAIMAGKHVLVEKAFTRNRGEAAHVVATAKAAGVLALEAMWTRYLPRMDVVRRVVDDGLLGDVLTVQADHGQALLHVPRLVQPELAGGALLDLGIYPVSFAAFVLGLPREVRAAGQLTDAGVDAQDVIALSGFAAHPGAMADLHTTMLATTPTRAVIAGTAARLELDGPFYHPGRVRLVAPDGAWVEDAPAAIAGPEGMCYEAAHLARLVADGASDSPLLPMGESVAIMGVLDQIREQVGVAYPGE